MKEVDPLTIAFGLLERCSLVHMPEESLKSMMDHHALLLDTATATMLAPWARSTITGQRGGTARRRSVRISASIRWRAPSRRVT